MDFGVYGLVSTLVILKGCNPVIPQLHAMQMLWNITDDHAEGQNLDFYKYYFLDLGLWNLEESADFVRTLSFFPTYVLLITSAPEIALKSGSPQKEMRH